MKTCSRCQETKELTEFQQYKSGPREGKYYSGCKECRYEELRRWKRDDPEGYASYNRRRRYRRKYGLDEKDVKKFGECPICLNEKKLVVDHCHTKGHVRGFICYSCNTLLGSLENRDKMKRAREYLNGK